MGLEFKFAFSLISNLTRSLLQYVHNDSWARDFQYSTGTQSTHSIKCKTNLEKMLYEIKLLFLLIPKKKKKILETLQSSGRVFIYTHIYDFNEEK